MVMETIPSCRIPLTQKLIDRFASGSINIHTYFKVLNASAPNSRVKEEFSTAVRPELMLVDICLNLLFTIELILLFATTPNRRRFFLDPINATELCALIAYFIPFVMMQLNTETLIKSPAALKGTFLLYSLRVLRVFRLLKMARFVVGLRAIILTIKSSLKELGLLVMVMAIGMGIFASLMYYAEFENVQSDFLTIPDGFWWALITMTTVGYGDMAPRVWNGYLVGMVCAISGIVITGLPIPIISNNFNTYYGYAKKLQAKRLNQEKRKKAKVGQTSVIPRS